MSRIRQFRWSDYEAVAEVWRAAGTDVVGRAELEAKLTRDPELFLVAEAPAGPRGIGGAVMGTFDGRRGWIFRLAVHPAHRRGGMATGLVAELEQRLTNLGCPRINLLVLPDNEAGLRFWQRLGYLPCPDVLFTKPLATSPSS
ncbi:acetyltransferase [Actinoplanes italicus]|uniref:Ribosomal protein S18 acetylase RimI-like enzyme n=1 Tax=Actinoplanes italicus TaxID=113567 RepID=A0A2T0KGS4_9ACTN|nr:GNAT family N-acetyltransferase [Actinoplanes italicus]PRX22636.1 ribosomal protein S18 acetylase RimI-like enzyme [Actinoplanes italicus]GIE28155.1 acetyltransferase [Actinoplanes italicus]